MTGILKGMNAVTRPKLLRSSAPEGKENGCPDLIQAMGSLLSGRSLMRDMCGELEVRDDVAKTFPTHIAIDAERLPEMPWDSGWAEWNGRLYGFFAIFSSLLTRVADTYVQLP